VGQLLDYAANAVVYWPLQMIRAKFEAAAEAAGHDPDEQVRRLLLPDAPEEADVDTFWSQVKTNLQAGKVRLVFVADVVPPELRRIVEFLNEQMDPAEVLAVEVRQYVGQGIQPLVRRVVGQTAEAQQRKSSSRQKNKWDEASFFAELALNATPSEVAVARRIFEWAKTNVDDIWWGEGRQIGSFVPILMHKEQKHQLFVIWSNGYLETYFQHYQSKPAFAPAEKRRQLWQRLNEIPGVDLPEDAIARRPTIPLAVFTEEERLDQLLQVFEWVIEEIKAS
jgi:trans-aconitate methyltransferase